MKRLILIVPLIILAFTVKAQVPFYGDRVFISSDKQDTMTLRFVGDTVFFVSDNGFFKFSKAISVDSIRLKDGKWIKGIVTTETDPVYNSEKSTILLKADSSSIYGTRFMVGRSIKDSLANLKTKFLILTFKPVRDSLNYEMTGYGKTYKIPVRYTIFRPSGAGTVSSVKIDSKNLTVPALSEGATYTGTDTITFAGPACPTCVTSFSQTYNLKVAAGRDTITQPLILNQYWKVYAVPLYSIYNSGGVQKIYDSEFLHASGKSELLVSGQAFLKNYSPVGQQLVLGLPTEFSGRTIYINGLPVRLTQYATYNNNFVNKRNAAHKYVGFLTAAKIKGTILTIEIR